MRILLIHQYYNGINEPGGSRWSEITKTWSELENEIVVLSGMVDYTQGIKRDIYKRKIFLKENPEKNIIVVRCHVSEAYNVNFLGRLWAYFSFVFSSTFAGLFKISGKFDIIIVTSPPLFVGITAYIISLVKRTPFIFEIRDLWPESAIDTGVLTNKSLIKFAYWFESFLYKKAKLINVLTPAFKQNLIEKKNVSESKISYIPNAADFSLTESLVENFDVKAYRKSLGIDNNFVIVYVGAHGVANHLVQILDTAEKLTDTNVLFMLIGDGMLKQGLINDAQNRNLKNVRFIDSVPKKDIFKYILASDMGTSVLKKNDTFKTVYSNKTFDYMSCKKPILMAIDGVSRTLVEEAEAGVFVEPENAFDFEQKIRYYLNNPQIAIKQGNNGYVYAKTYFDRSVLAKKYIKIVEQCI
ncbi:glycosyltransferase family 4 protein [Emticicia sp. C21]|uniref:glycosyltransferase family 4 protein n=1 Tax=Emticicia sp. C21 TaxID=2302915 RepID=UPI000E340ED9|nr:glycosyltransferase family 4 protein [Emticicia sp. C21]RFS17232.1 glycosyltransferase WbuB [Emticicia sp. C21]